MDWIAIGLGILVTIALIAFVTQPWWNPRRAALAKAAGEEHSQIERLARERESVLSALRDLDFDYTVGKVTEEDYGPTRQALLARAAAVLRQLDEARATTDDLDARIEAEILAVRRKLRPGHTSQTAASSSPTAGLACPTCGRRARPGDLYCTGCGTHLNLTCPRCGKPVRRTDHFCAGCGIELALAMSG